MTREEAIKELSEEYLGDSERMIKAKKMSVKALKQEPIIDKIRAEIEALPIAFTSSFEMKQDCLDILDKYKGESEE